MLNRIFPDARRALIRKLSPAPRPQRRIEADPGFRRVTAGGVESEDGVEIAWRLWGRPAANRPTLVLIHGLGANQTQFEQDAAWFAAGGFATLTLDLRGHGASTRPSPFARAALTPDKMATDIERAMAAARVRDACLVGASMGGLAALALVARGGPAAARIAALVTFGATYSLNYPAGFPAMHRLAYGVVGHRRFVESIAAHASAEPRAREIVRRMYADYAPELSFLITQNIRKYDYREAARAFARPILILRGEEDRDINRHLGATLRRLGDAAHVETQDLARAGHFANLDQPAAFRGAVLAFLQRAG